MNSVRIENEIEQNYWASVYIENGYLRMLIARGALYYIELRLINLKSRTYD